MAVDFEVALNKVSWFDVLFVRWVALLKIIITNTNMWLLKKSNGRLGNSFLGVSILLIHTVGCKSGLKRVTPLFYLQDDDKIILVASNGGNVKNPAWLNNIKANPVAKVKIKGTETIMHARIVNAEEHRHYWPMVIDMFSSWEKIQDRSVRDFPIVVLEAS